MYRKISRIEYGDYLLSSYRKPFVRAITLWRLVGDREKIQETIKKLNEIDKEMHSGIDFDPYQHLDILNHFYDALLRTFGEMTEEQHLADVEEKIRQRIKARLVTEDPQTCTGNIEQSLGLSVSAMIGTLKQCNVRADI